jgi:galactose mutarotase-like enzyme
MICLGTPHLKVKVDESKGAEIVWLGTPGGPNRLAWIDSDWPLRASAGASYYSSDLDWLSEHRGGWQEMFPNAGAGCTVGGITHPVHGEASLAPWDVVETNGENRVVLRCHTHTPLVLTRTMSMDPDRPRLVLQEEIHNPSDLDFPYLWGHHPTFAAPPGTRLALESARFEVPGLGVVEEDLSAGGSGIWPWAVGKDGEPVDLGVMPSESVERLAYLTHIPESACHIFRPDTRDRLTFEWSPDAFPFAWLWINRQASRFPWFGRLSSMAVEPVNAYPADGLAAAVERGQAPILSGGESRQAWLSVSIRDL